MEKQVLEYSSLYSFILINLLFCYYVYDQLFCLFDAAKVRRLE